MNSPDPLCFGYLSAQRLFTGLLVCAGLLVWSGCGEKEVILPGKREAVLIQAQTLELDPQAASEAGAIGSAVENESAGHPGLNSGHQGGHLTLALPLGEIWSAQIAEPEDDVVMLAQPVIANALVYALGADARLTAFDLETGEVSWQAQVNDSDTGLFPGRAGGMAANGSVVAVHAARKTLAVFEASTGAELWSAVHDSPLAGGPTLINNDAVVVTDIDGYVFVYGLGDGVLRWRNVGLPVETIVFGASSPAVNGGELVIAGAGGEVSVHRLSDGQLLWAESLANFSPTTPLEELGDVLAHPVHDGRQLYVISQSGLLSAFDARTGVQIWEHAVAGVQMPWLAGDSLFVISVDGRLLCLRRTDGAVRWIADLDSGLPGGVTASNAVRRYFGPVVASGLVHAVSQGGRLVSLDADTGKLVETTGLDSDVVAAPQIAGSIFVYLTASGQLTALR